MSKWIYIQDFGKYEKFVSDWHYFAKETNFLYLDRKSTRLNSSHVRTSRMPSVA